MPFSRTVSCSRLRLSYHAAHDAPAPPLLTLLTLAAIASPLPSRARWSHAEPVGWLLVGGGGAAARGTALVGPLIAIVGSCDTQGRRGEGQYIWT